MLEKYGMNWEQACQYKKWRAFCEEARGYSGSTKKWILGCLLNTYQRFTEDRIHMGYLSDSDTYINLFPCEK
jgi:hypothetical protein